MSEDQISTRRRKYKKEVYSLLAKLKLTKNIDECTDIRICFNKVGDKTESSTPNIVFGKCYKVTMSFFQALEDKVGQHYIKKIAKLSQTTKETKTSEEFKQIRQDLLDLASSLKRTQPRALNQRILRITEHFSNELDSAIESAGVFTEPYWFEVCSSIGCFQRIFDEVWGNYDEDKIEEEYRRILKWLLHRTSNATNFETIRQAARDHSNYRESYYQIGGAFRFNPNQEIGITVKKVEWELEQRLGEIHMVKIAQFSNLLQNANGAEDCLEIQRQLEQYFAETDLSYCFIQNRVGDKKESFFRELRIKRDFFIACLGLTPEEFIRTRNPRKKYQESETNIRSGKLNKKTKEKRKPIDEKYKKELLEAKLRIFAIETIAEIKNLRRDNDHQCFNTSHTKELEKKLDERTDFLCKRNIAEMRNTPKERLIREKKEKLLKKYREAQEQFFAKIKVESQETEIKKSYQRTFELLFTWLKLAETRQECGKIFKEWHKVKKRMMKDLPNFETTIGTFHYQIFKIWNRKGDELGLHLANPCMRR